MKKELKLKNQNISINIEYKETCKLIDNLVEKVTNYAIRDFYCKDYKNSPKIMIQYNIKNLFLDELEDEMDWFLFDPDNTEELIREFNLINDENYISLFLTNLIKENIKFSVL